MKQLAGAAFGVAALAALGWLLDRYLNAYYLNILVRVGINVILAVSLNLINGFTGLFSIGHAGFMAIGAYTAAAVSVYGGPGLHGMLDPVAGPAFADVVLLTI